MSSTLHKNLEVFQKTPGLSLIKQPLPKAQITPYYSDLKITETTEKKTMPIIDNKIGFGVISTDHMIQIDYDSVNGWQKPEIMPYQDLRIDPMATVFHYGLECYEGMKAYIDKNGKIRMFRPLLNLQRMRHTSMRLNFPDFDPEEVLKIIKKLVKMEERWIPNIKEYSLYIRPTVISTWDRLGVAVPQKTKFFCIASLASSYFPQGLFPLKIYVEQQAIRAHHGSNTGQYKIGGNYAQTIYFKDQAIKQYNCNEILYLFDDMITELGAANLFIYWKNEDGEEELRTHPPDDLILHGITRESVIELAKQDGMKVTQKPITFTQVKKALKENRLFEIFCCGTAVIISSLGELVEGENIIHQIPYDKEKGIGPLANKLRTKLLDIQMGDIESDWSVVVE